MKLYNRNLEEIKDNSRENRMQALVNQVIDFLTREYSIDKQFLQEKAEKIAFVERESAETYFVEYNGRKDELSNVGAESFVTHKKQEYDGEKWNFENAIYTSDINKDHTIKHELFHYFSDILSMEFNENGIGYDKSGIKIVGYDKDDKLVDDSIDATGLNEGITELLAQKLDKSSTLQNSYAYQVSIADILINSKNQSLIKAYFSKDENEFKSFLKEFDKRQSTISSKDLVGLLANDSFDNINKDLLKGCLEYTLSFCVSKEEFSMEKNRLIQIVENIGIADYKDGVNTKQYLIDTINEMEQQLERNTLESKQNFRINEYGEIIRENNEKNEVTELEMETLPNGIKIPKKQYEEEQGTSKPKMHTSKKSRQALKKDILDSKVTTKEMQQQTKAMDDILKVKKLMFNQKCGAVLTDEQKALIEQHTRQTNEVQVRFRNQQDQKNNEGLEM